MEHLKIIKPTYLEQYKEKQPISILKHFNKIKAIDLNTKSFDFYISNSAVYSSMIEGNRIDFDSYLKYHHSGMNTNGKSYREIEDLKMAYTFAKTHKPTLNNALAAHRILSETIISDDRYRGMLRNKEVYVFNSGVKVYTGANEQIVHGELEQLFSDIAILQSRELSMNEVFYFASMIHLIFVHIHPFADGNGRTARLVEKWFLAEKLGEKAWFIQSERLYHKRIASYYLHVNCGATYNTIDYSQSIPFALMLPMALRLK